MHIQNVFFLPINVLARDNFGFVEPFPRNIFAVEFTSANVTCIAYDSLGIKIPEKIIFVRRDIFGGYHELASNGTQSVALTSLGKASGYKTCS